MTLTIETGFLNGGNAAVEQQNDAAASLLNYADLAAVEIAAGSTIQAQPMDIWGRPQFTLGTPALREYETERQQWLQLPHTLVLDEIRTRRQAISAERAPILLPAIIGTLALDGVQPLLISPEARPVRLGFHDREFLRPTHLVQVIAQAR